ncbi:DUF3427 domain-containing protein [Methanosphaera sp. WGK6]|uniref:DUF3427 domain-containing protein n=1 Tax=Methanosphaera sp. WGK6 TaxID=1561964 RepID=UPI00084C0344|nr:DEAD/DEAH box helicase [Methanosphaera sp. WGK6]OED30028.1 helicase [Methanosphaera sp. WGK6]
MNPEISIIKGAKKAFIDEHYPIYDNKPELILNNKDHKVLNSIKDELNNCDEFYISVAFITLSGITPLLEDLKELEYRGIQGKILTTDYLNFSEPAALKKLNNFQNIEVKIYSQQKEGFHTKGYIFRNKDIYRGIVGSSNLTMNALTINKEWNIGFTSLNQGEIIQDICHELDELWKKADNLDDVIEEYTKNYEKNKFKDFQKSLEHVEQTTEELIPNSMQQEFIENLRELMKKGEKRALLVSATGTGKTYASAFAVKDAHPKKFLFLVHREQIAKQAIKSYKQIFKDEKEKFGLLSGTSKETDKDYLFSTVQSMSKEETYTHFKPDTFDYIIIDEVHRAGATSYTKLLDYFKPKFCLGMSASPDRTDSFNIYELFDYNVPLDIRLQDALDKDLLCPFHYFGIHDIKVDGKVLEDNSDFRFLVSEDRVNYILKNSEYYGYSGDRLKSLIFCSTKKEAHTLAESFNKKGHPSIALTGDNSQKEREEAIIRLTDDTIKDNLEYIFTVDIFNEGVDIPEVNQVILLRPTESSIIFIQQLGRGLRKFNNKEYVVIIDFIGNYKQNYLIPIALSGDMSHDKDNLRKYLMEGTKIIPGQSSISFDRISKKKIYESINNTNFSRIALFKEHYQKLKYRLGHVPYLVDFYRNKELDPSLILSHSKFKCYYSFLKHVDKEYNGFLSDDEIRSLEFVTSNFSNGKRPHELLILKLLIKHGYFSIALLENELKKAPYRIKEDYKSIIHCFRMFNLNFFVKKDVDYYSNVKFFEFDNSLLEHEKHLRNEKFMISDEFKSFLDSDTYKYLLDDVLDFGLDKYLDNYMQTDSVNLNLYSKYSRKDVCRLLNWSHDDSSTMYGYQAKHDTCPIFVTLKKTEDISESTKYKETFESRYIFSWMTRSKRTLKSKEILDITQNENLRMHLFVKKSDDADGNEFYYLGQVNHDDGYETTIKNDKGTLSPIVNFKLSLHHPVKEELYNYLNEDIG